jgi:hypothetical protein
MPTRRKVLQRSRLLSKVRRQGYASVVDPAVEAYHYERADRQNNSAVERERL